MTSTPVPVPAALAEHAEQLLAGTGLPVAQAVTLAQRADDPGPDLSGPLVAALRAGWATPELAERTDRSDTEEWP